MLLFSVFLISLLKFILIFYNKIKFFKKIMKFYKIIIISVFIKIITTLINYLIDEAFEDYDTSALLLIEF